MKTAILTRNGEDDFTAAQKTALQSAEPVYIATPKPLQSSEMIRLLRDFGLVAMTPDAIRFLDRETMNQLPRLRVIATSTTGTEWIDTAHAKSLAIKIKNVTDCFTTAAVENLLWMMLGFARQGFELEGKTLGIVGLGKIGAKLAFKAGVLGLKIHHYDPVFKVGSYTAVPLDKLLSSSDIVALCCPHQPKPLIGTRELALMKAGAFLVNISPSSLVDRVAVEAALKNQTLGGYAADDEKLISRVAEAKLRAHQQWVQNIISSYNVLYKPSTAAGPRLPKSSAPLSG